jgi:hypothetical protein
MHIIPPYRNFVSNDDMYNYNSKLNPLTKDELYKYLDDLNLLESK